MPSTFLVLTLTLVALHTTLTAAVPIVNSGNAYTEDAGEASGGDVDNAPLDGPLGRIIPGGLLSIGSNNAGDGGISKSGNAFGGLPIFSTSGRGGGFDNNGNAYTGKGGKANGGSVKGKAALISILSGNAGDAGDASSGIAVGGGALGGLSDQFRDRGEDDREDSDDDRSHEHSDEHHEHHDDRHEHSDDEHNPGDHEDHHHHHNDCDC